MTRDAVDIGTIGPLLQRWAEQVLHVAVRVSDVRAMPGNSGLSFGFAVTGAGEPKSFVIRLAPPGVARRGNTDVLRQVPLLDVLARSSVPVPAVRWWTADERWFGTDAFVQDLVPALPLHMTDASLSTPVALEEVPVLLERAVDALVAVHRVPLAELASWEEPRRLDDELSFWGRVLAGAGDASWTTAGDLLRGALRDHAPATPRTGLFHGDFQTNNVLYDEKGRVAAVVDWEIAGIGLQGLDLGWLAMMCDPTCWDAGYASRLRVLADPEDLRRRYEHTEGRAFPGLSWYQALACYRFGAIAAYNYRLHRTGRRVDAAYELMASSVAVLLRRGAELASFGG